MTISIYIPQESTALALGADEIATKITEEATKRGLDIAITRNGSRGMLWAEPLLEVDVEGIRHGYANIDPDNVTSLFDANFLTGGIHPSSLGPVEEVDYLKNQDRVIFARAGLDDPTDINAYQTRDGFSALKKALEMSASDITEEVFASGLRGRGGAGFPTGIKWRTVMAAQADEKHIVANADEGDSGTFSDRLVMECDPYRLIEGMTLAGLATHATNGVIYLRSEYPVAAKILSTAIQRANDANLLGTNILGSGIDFNLKLFVAAGAYICGEETALLESLEGKRGQVRAKPPLPALEGLFGKPTVINNVITFCSVPEIISNGGDWYANLGMGRSTGTMPFQLGGNIKRGGLVEKAFGVTLRDLIETFGHGTRTGQPFRAAQIGGPLGAYVPDSLLDLPMDYETLMKNGVGVGHGGMVIFDDSVDMLAQARYAFEFCVHESCGKCTPCRIGSVRGKETIDKIAAGTNIADNLDLVADLCDVMEDGSLCAMGGMTPIPVRSAIKYFQEDFTPAASIAAE